MEMRVATKRFLLLNNAENFDEAIADSNLPHAPPHMLGVMNLRGVVIPIIDLAERLGVHGSVDTPLRLTVSNCS
ncbi:hypothetical protein EXN23_25815 [Agrobacterium salinitolerans]|nr:hypothetical protein EXN23_25815 [Agrobacterium salinitolerans]